MPNSISVVTNDNTAFPILRSIGEAKAREFVDLVQCVYKQKPNPKDTKDLERWLDEYPEIWHLVFDMSCTIEENLIKGIVSNPGAHLAIKKNSEEIRLGLGFEGASLMEKLLINNIVVSWLRLQWAEYRLIQIMGQDETVMSLVGFWEKRLSVAQPRFLRACETLEKIRKLSAKNPTMQINIATQSGQQVNIAGNLVKK